MTKSYVAKSETRPGYYIALFAPMYQAFMAEELCPHFVTKKAAVERLKQMNADSEHLKEMNKQS
jgi:hypothetical protein